MLTDRRYTDRDVREQPDLVIAAYAWLRHYEGDFEFLVRAKKYLLLNGWLPTVTTRGILNCMRADPGAASLLWKRPHTEPILRRTGNRLRIVERSRPAIIDLPCTWHRNYVLSLFTTARTYHYLDQIGSIIRYYPHKAEFKCLPRAACGRNLPDNLWLAMTNYPERYTVRGFPRVLCKGCAQLDNG